MQGLKVDPVSTEICILSFLFTDCLVS